MKEDNRPKVSFNSERVVVDSIFADGTLRLLRSPRRKSSDDDRLEITGWGKEIEHEVSTHALEAILFDELDGRKIMEGDVFFIADGPDFFERKIKELENQLIGERIVKVTRDLIKELEIESERLILPIEESKWMARQEIKTQFAMLIATQGIQDPKLRNQIAAQAEKAVKTRIEIEKATTKTSE